MTTVLATLGTEIYEARKDKADDLLILESLSTL